MRHLAGDLRFALRILLKKPAFSAFAILALALGIGANTAIFSLIDGVLLQPLQFEQPDRLVQLFEDLPAYGATRNPTPPADFADWQSGSRSFSGMAAEFEGILNVTGSGAAPEEVECANITPNLLPLLGAQPFLGRNIDAAEAHPNPDRVVLVSYGMWERRFGASRDALGRTIELDREPYRVIGVMPPGFRFPEGIDLWRPANFRTGSGAILSRGVRSLRVFARLRSGVSLQTAQGEMSTIAARLAREHPDSNKNVFVRVVGLRDAFVGNLRTGICILWGGVICLLLIACANVAGLLLARAAGRRRELAVRAALGASRPDLVRQGLVEALVLALAGGFLGAFFAAWSLPLLAHLVPGSLAASAAPRIGLRVLLFTFGVSAASALAFGAFPALALSRTGLDATLRAGGRGASYAGSRARRFIVSGEVALATVLLVAALLLAQTLWNLSRVPLGFQPAHVVTARTSLPLSPQSPYRSFDARLDFYNRVLDAVRRIPGVESAGYTTFLPLTNRGGATVIEIEGRPAPKPGEWLAANHRVVTRDYLQTIGDPLVAGRYFDDSDRPGSPQVAIVNQAWANRFCSGRNPVDLQFRLQSDADPQPWIRIAGLVGDVRQVGLDLVGVPEMYFPATQASTSFGYFTPRDLAVRLSGRIALNPGALRRAVWSVDPNQPVIDIQPMQALVDKELAARDIQVKLICAFAAVALLLAALGLYGLIAFTVAQRVRDIGVRMALGARPARIVRDTLWDGFRLIAVGIAAGVGAAWLFSRALASMLYGVAPRDPSVFLTAAGALVLAGLLAGALPARRAASINPLEALRHE